MDMDSHLTNARHYLIKFLDGKGNPYETRHPWRKDWQFAVQHSLRVEAYTLKILKRETHSLSEADILSLRLAAILHDIGRMEITDNHATLGARIAGEWLKKYAANRLSLPQIDSIIDMIAMHSIKDQIEENFSKAVLKDADTLDEIGVMSIFMTSNWVDHHSPFFFSLLRQRLIEFELSFCAQKQAILNTQGARKILAEKTTFINRFIDQLTDELEGEVVSSLL